MAGSEVFIRCGSQVCLTSNECLQRLQLKSEEINQSVSRINDASLVVNHIEFRQLLRIKIKVLRGIILCYSKIN